MTLQLADHSITRPYDVVEDALVTVRQFTFSVDFVIMNIEEDSDIPPTGFALELSPLWRLRATPNF